MARYSVFIKPSALKELERVGSKSDRQRIVEHIRSLADDPHLPGSLRLSGADKYRLRCGHYRILYTIEHDRLVVCVIRIGHRRDVYRGIG